MKSSGSVVTIGTFDGVHLGHRSILEKTTALARRRGERAVAVTFRRPPRLFFFPSQEAELLTSVEEKTELLKSCGMEKVLVLDFNARLAKMSAASFFRNVLLARLGARAVVVGYNFGFGRKREGDARALENLGAAHDVSVTIVAPYCLKKVPVSSGRVRECLKAGRLEEANRLLGYPYFSTGEVVRGRRIGTAIGAPTANLKVEPDKILPGGVFLVRARIAGKKGAGRFGIANIGTRPTVNTGAAQEKTFEAHLFGFRGELYGRRLRVELLRKLREERKFESLAALKAQINKDKKKAAALLSSMKLLS